MPSGLAALLDDVAAIAKLAAASVDDVSLAAGPRRRQGGGRGDRRCGGDAALRHRLHPGSRAADHLADRQGLAEEQAAVHPAGRAAAERVPALGDHADPDDRRRLSLLRGRGKGDREAARRREERAEELAEEVAALNAADHEETMVAGAIRTDFILSAEIMAIALDELASGGALAEVGEGLPPVVSQALALAIVAVAITDRRLWRGRPDREDGRYRPAHGEGGIGGAARDRARPGPRDAEAAVGARADRHGGDALGRRPDHRSRPGAASRPTWVGAPWRPRRMGRGRGDQRR